MKKCILLLLLISIYNASYSQIYKSKVPFESKEEGYYYGIHDGVHVKVWLNENEAKAYKFFEQKDYTNCIKSSLAAVSNHYRTYNESKMILSYLYYIIGVSFSKAGLGEEAILYYTKSIEENNSTDIFFNVNFQSIYSEEGKISVRQSNKSFKEEFTGRSLNIGDIYFRRGIEKTTLGDKGGALNDFKKANSFVKNSFYMTMLAVNLMSSSSISERIECKALLDEAIKMDNSNGEAYFFRGILYISENYNVSGCEYLSRAGELGYSKAYESIREFCN